MTSAKLNVVIVGGNFGAHVARSLSGSLDPAKYNLILVNSRPYRLHLIAAARMVVSDLDHLDSEDAAFARYDRLFRKNNGTFVCGTVTGIEKESKGGGRVILADGKKIDFHALVLATGSLWSGPFAIPDGPADVSRFINDTRQMFKDAHNVVLVGGGALAFEVAGEIRETWPEKNVTIVHRGKQLLTNVYTDRFRNAAAKDLKARNIRLILNDSLDSVDLPDGATSVKSNKGEIIEADLVLPMWGTRPNTGYVGSSLGPDVLADNGCVKVKSTLQLPDHPDIFAMGDMIDWPEVKQSLKANRHSLIVSANVLNYLNGKPLKEYKGSTEVLVLTGGKTHGLAFIGVLWGIILGAWFARLNRGRNLAVPYFRRTSGY